MRGFGWIRDESLDGLEVRKFKWTRGHEDNSNIDSFSGHDPDVTTTSFGFL